MALLLAFVVAVGVTMALIPPLIKWAPRLQFVDMPGNRKVHANPVPRVGGIAMAVGVFLAWAVWGQMNAMIVALVAGIVVLLFFGIWDDRAALSAGVKLIGQCIAAAIVMWFGGIKIGSITLADRYALPEFVSLPLTFVFLVGATNAINLADGLDGLAGGTTMMCLAGLALLAFTVGNVQVGGAALLIIGAVLGFLRYNTYPARVFMGDSGSQLLGFSAAVLAIMLTQDANVPLSSALPLLLLGVPIIDTLLVMLGRIATGQSPFKADRNHIHHRLLALGFDHHEAVMTIYLAQAIFFIAAWFMRYESDVAIVVVFISCALFATLPLVAAKMRGWRWRESSLQGEPSASRLRALIVWLAKPERLPLWSIYVIALAFALYAAAVLSADSSLPRDAMFLAGGAVLILAINITLRWHAIEIGWIDKSALYLSAVLLVFLNEFASREPVALRHWSWLPIVAIAAAVAVRMRLSLDRRFVVTPLDLLVIIVAAVVPNLPDSIASPRTLGAGVAKLVVLFYGIESLSIVAQKRWKWLSVSALIVFGVCVLRGL